MKKFLALLLLSLSLPVQASASFQDGLPVPYMAPELAGIQTWLNSPPLTMASLRGKVVLVDFWAYSCINCVRTLPYLTQWDKQYRDRGLVIVGVHTPEFEFEKSTANVKAAVAEHGIEYPVALDNRMASWTNFKNRYWPAHYLIDRQGKIVYTHFGEGQYEVTENNIRYLLGLDEKDNPDEPHSPLAERTPETYLGYARAVRFSGTLKHDIPADYNVAQTLPLHGWGLRGSWKAEAQKITSLQAGASLKLHFKARKIFLVLGTAKDKPLVVDIAINGEKRPSVTVQRHTLYPLLDQQEPMEGLLEITVPEGLEAYAFTFG